MSQSSYWAYLNIFYYYYTSPQPFFFSSQNWVTNVKHYKTFLFFVEPKLFIEQAKPPILSKAQEFLSLAIFEKKKKNLMIQTHGKTILSMEFKSIIQVHN